MFSWHQKLKDIIEKIEKGRWDKASEIIKEHRKYKDDMIKAASEIEHETRNFFAALDNLKLLVDGRLEGKKIDRQKAIHSAIYIEDVHIPKLKKILASLQLLEAKEE